MHRPDTDTDPLASMRDDKGKLPSFAWPGGYPIIYLTQENDILCPSCANDVDPYDPDTFDMDKPVACDCYWEGPHIQCDGCNGTIESAYGDPYADERGTE